MKSEWKTVFLADVIKIISGGTPKTSIKEYWNGDIPWLSIADFNTKYRWVSYADKSITERGLIESSTALLNEGDVIISARGTVGALAQLSVPMAFNQSCYGIREKPEITCIDYIYYCLHKTIAEMKQKAHGGVFSTITRNTFKIIEISLPPLSEQRAIAHILGTLDDKIELNRKQNETLEEMARALFKAWFVDFEPVRAKIEGRWKRGQSLPGLPTHLYDLFPSRLVESELGEIPEGWEVVEAGNVYDIGIGKTPPRKEQHWFSENPKDVPWVSIRNMGESGTYIISTSEYLTPEAVKRFNIRVVPSGTVLLSFKLTVGRLTITDTEMTTNEAIAHFKPKHESPSQTFLYCYLNFFRFSELSSTSSIGTATNSKAIREIPILKANTHVMEGFDSFCKPLFEQIRETQHQIDLLAELRDTLLPKLISGELRVKDAERFLQKQFED